MTCGGSGLSIRLTGIQASSLHDCIVLWQILKIKVEGERLGRASSFLLVFPGQA